MAESGVATETDKIQKEEEEIFTNLKYVCSSTTLITKSLQNGYNVAQLANGDIIVTEVKTINVYYSWDPNKNKLVKLSQL